MCCFQMLFTVMFSILNLRWRYTWIRANKTVSEWGFPSWGHDVPNLYCFSEEKPGSKSFCYDIWYDIYPSNISYIFNTIISHLLCFHLCLSTNSLFDNVICELIFILLIRKEFKELSLGIFLRIFKIPTTTVLLWFSQSLIHARQMADPWATYLSRLEIKIGFEELNMIVTL